MRLELRCSLVFEGGCDCGFRGWKGTLQDFIVLSLGRCAQTECSWPHRTDASGSLNVSDVAAVDLVGSLRQELVVLEGGPRWGMCTVF